MCGLTGTFLQSPEGAEKLRDVVQRMTNPLAHRGPDDTGIWVGETGRIGLGHRRLSILDLSPEGHQPMRSPSGRYVLAFNGEVYNHVAIRSELDGITWRGHSDTETILAAIDVWGIERAVERFVGMFAIALWDRQRDELILVRDRVGIKPLYYGFTPTGLVFGSELSALRNHPDFVPDVDRDVLALYLRYNSIPAPHTIYARTRKVLPGTILRFRAPRFDATEATTYWSAADVAVQGQQARFAGPAEEAVDHLDRLLRDAVGMRMLADVPLGAFLSGGVDSSVVVAQMQAQSDRPVRTFTIGSPDAGFNEAPQARAVAEHLGTDHTELCVTSAEALDTVPLLASMFDEPFADSSQIPTYLVSRLARRDVTVTLSGDGGDELFAGYNRHVWAGRVWRGMRTAPRWARGALAGAITRVSPDRWDRWFRAADPILPSPLRQRMPGYKLHKLAGSLNASSSLELYRTLASQWSDPSRLVRGGKEPDERLPESVTGLPDFSSQMMLLDTLRYLPDDILAKVDRTSMAVSLEARVPILDHRVIEFAWQLPLSMKLHDGKSKWALRQVLYRYVPKELIERPKTGFGIPLGSWLRGPLREWAEALLDERRLREEGFFDPRPIREAWGQHLAGTHTWEHQLWTILMFQGWLEHNSLQPDGPQVRAPGTLSVSDGSTLGGTA